jgi:hypothetical protein
MCWIAQHRTVQCHPQDSPVRGPPNSLLSGFPSYVGYNSPDSPHEAPDSSVYQPCNDYLPRRPRANDHMAHRTIRCPTPDSPVPHGKGNQPIRRFSVASCARTVHCPVCTEKSSAPTDRRQELPTKWSSNGS